MKTFTMLLISLLVLSLVLSAVSCGEEETTEPVTLRLAHGYTVGEVYDLEIQKFADLVEEYTDGLVTIDIYPASTLFRSYELWEAVTTGAVDFYFDSAYYMARFIPDLVILWTEGMWSSWEHGFAVKDDGRLFDSLAQSIEAAGPVKVLGWPEEICINTITISKEKELFSRFDEEGLKMHAPPGAFPAPSSELLNSTLIEVPYEEMYIALAQGIIDGATTSLPRYYGLKLYELAPHACAAIMAYGSWVTMMNEDTWNGLSTEVQDIIQNQVMPELLAYSRVAIQEYMDEVLAFAEEVSETYHVSTWDTHPEYYNGLRETSTFKTMRLMPDPELVEIVDNLNPMLQE
ncbi:MAG: TRAP transporter substrate-binding protein DctP [Dehalococcoidia bacterium]|nr:MAG: TRAP transporter substrate-binding protein DctP [Dehalococcoidia bacterium]